MIEIEIGVSRDLKRALEEDADMEYFLRKMKGALMVPKEYLNA